MPLDIVMPKLGLTMSEGLIVEWNKTEGDQVKKGEILFALETEKTIFEVESPDDGTLGKILVQAGQTVPVGTVVAYLLRRGESASDIKTAPSDRCVQSRHSYKPKGENVSGLELQSPVLIERTGGIRIKASPLAKKIAETYNIDLRKVIGSGPNGRIVRDDVEKAYRQMQGSTSIISTHVEEAPAEKLVKLTGMRKTIAKKMLASKVETAQTYMSNTMNAENIVEYRKILLPHIQEKFGVRVTITDILMKIAGAAVREHPILNTRWTDGGILYFQEVHMGMALALDDGLIVPVIRDINKKRIPQIAKERIEFIRKGKNKEFLPDDISGSTFTLSTMGMFGVEQFTANINLPENAILAVGMIMDKPVAVEGEVVIRPMMNVTLSYDHRTIDGAKAAKFMQTLKLFIENPIMMLA